MALGDHIFIIFFVAEKLTCLVSWSLTRVWRVTSEWRRMLLDFWKAVKIGVFVISWAGHLSSILTRKMQCATNVDSCIIVQTKQENKLLTNLRKPNESVLFLPSYYQYRLRDKDMMLTFAHTVGKLLHNLVIILLPVLTF